MNMLKWAYLFIVTWVTGTWVAPEMCVKEEPQENSKQDESNFASCSDTSGQPPLLSSFPHLQQSLLSCTYCTYSTKKQVNLDNHITSFHTKNYRFNCEVCGMGFVSHHRLNYHRRIEHEDLRFPCKHCGKVFKYQESLSYHIKTHKPNYTKKRKIRDISNREPCVCQLCNKILGSKIILQNHMRLHTNPQSFVCDICGKVLATNVSLVNHRKIHTGEKEKFHCDVCGKSVTTKQKLIDHKMTHTGEKPFVCEFCGSGFIRRATLEEHSRVHTKERPFKCKLCEKGFAQRSTLTTHMFSHTGRRPHNCDKCGKGFIRRFQLNTHKCVTST
ncbi:gastrula zinc finger protein XlCGF7.1-like [Zophobas morio]|uniref:gastrula zinc finger protein XlCGF7.1-like n=1 Tax=Zophobas morio TaxID=2755281 RepID=UPI003082F8B3